MTRLTQFARGGGCAAKLRLGDLSQVLGHLPIGATRSDVLVDHSYSDDAAVVRIGDRDMLLTIDVIAPLVDDPASFGAIAATNAMSDVWAMGGEPLFALNVVFFSDEQLPLSILDDILAGAARACEAVGVAIVGGHSVRDPELKFGQSITGVVPTGEAWTNRLASPGQAIVLTKALGTGVIGQAIKKGIASEAAAAAAIASMTTANQSGARIGRRHGVTAATDVTGFGLLNHLRNIARGSGVTASVELAKLPLLPDAKLHLAAKVCPAGSKANRAHVASDVRWADGSGFTGEEGEGDRELLASLACDAQTSGGLLLCLPADRAAACVDELRAAGLPAAAIGKIREPGVSSIVLE